jgi:hypothetical protein
MASSEDKYAPDARVGASVTPDVAEEGRMTLKVHLGPVRSRGTVWKVIFDPQCQRQDSAHGVGVVCEQLSRSAAERLRARLVAEGALKDAPRTWTDKQEAIRFLNKEVLRSQGA